MTELTTNDYKKILEFYGVTMPKSPRLIKNAADKILAQKLCRCIKKVEKNVKNTSEGRAIGICTKTIFNAKGYTRGKFKCRGKQSVKTRKLRKK